MKPLRLLHVVPTYLPAWRHGGPIVSVHGLCRALADRGHQVTVFTTDVDGPGRLDVPLGRPVDRDGVAVVYFAARSLRLHWSPALARALRRGVPDHDLVHVHSLFLPPVDAAAAAAEAAGVPYVLAPRGMLVRRLLVRRGRARKALWMALRGRRSIERAAFLHATSEREAADARELPLDLPPIEVVPNGVDLPAGGDLDPAAAELSPPVAEALAAGPFLLALGRIDWKKGLDRLVSALPEVPAVRLVVAGPDDGDRGRLEALAGSLGVDGRITWTGPVYGTDKATLYARAEALVLPSHHENFGNVVLEAMAAERPVVVTPEVGLAERVREAGAGVVTSGEPRRLAAALRELLADPAAAREMGRRGREVAAQYAWPRIAERMETAYRRAIETRRTANGTTGAREPER